ncbi:MAG: hypothetical protein IJT12_01035 [Paludibacteraceae bacterium]|nr:hypothetical protein [Paludibacteraceae bacterium]
MSLLDVEAVPRRTMTLFLLADVSGSMRGSKIGAVNDAIRNVLPIVNDINDSNADAEIKIAAMTFSSGCNWVYNEPKIAADFDWPDQTAGGVTDLGEACVELANKLSKSHGFMTSGSGSFAPVLILLSDGGPTDDFNGGLDKLKQNNWYKAAIKVAIAIGDDADLEVLAKFTGNIESVIQVHDVESLKKVIRCVVVTSSQVGSKSSSTTAGGAEPATKQDETNKAIAQQLQGADNVQIGTEAANVSMDDNW